MKVQHREENSPSTYRGRGIVTKPGDVRDVSDELGAALLEKPFFVPALDDGAGNDPDADQDDAGDVDQDDGFELEGLDDLDDADQGAELEDDVDFDADGWLADDYTDRAAAVEAGDVDDDLSTIREIETSDTVIESVEQRADEIGATLSGLETKG